MKFATAMLSALTAPLSGGSLRALVRLIVLFVLVVASFSIGFHWIMATEGREFSWVASVYWTIVTMSTLGFGDIVFESSLGQLYSVVVLLTGALLILILLPFTFIQLVYLPWREAARAARTPRMVDDSVSGHLILTGRGPMEEALIHRAQTAGLAYVLVVEDVEEAATLNDKGYEVLVGNHDEPETYRAARAEHAAMVLAAASDQANTNIAFTVREVTDKPLMLATAASHDSVDVLELAGCDHVLHLGSLLGAEFARRILAPTAKSSVISTFEDLLIAEASAGGTELVGRSLAELDLRGRFGVSVAGLWARGSLLTATSNLRVDDTSILLLVGTREQLDAYDEAYAPAAQDSDATGDEAPPVVILGGGRVGRAAARKLRQAGTPCCIVERQEERVRHLSDVIIGDAADRAVLRRAGIDDAPAVVVTTHDDDMNIYLTLYCRRLRPEAEILGRVALERNVTTMYRAGADFVLSYASTGAMEAWNTLRHNSTLLLAKGLVIFRVPVPERLVGRPLSATRIPDRTGCSVVAVVHDGTCRTDLDVDRPLTADTELLLIGDEEAEDRFIDYYGTQPASPGKRSWLSLGRSR